MKYIETQMRDGQKVHWRADELHGFVVGVDHISLYTSRDHVFHIAVNEKNNQALADWLRWLEEH